MYIHISMAMMLKMSVYGWGGHARQPLQGEIVNKIRGKQWQHKNKKRWGRLSF